MVESGSFSGLRTVRGALIEFTDAPDPLALFFDFNPSSMTRTRAVAMRQARPVATILPASQRCRERLKEYRHNRKACQPKSSLTQPIE